MSTATQKKITRREIRKAFTPVVADLIETDHARVQAHAAILHRGLWGRIKWLITGR